MGTKSLGLIEARRALDGTAMRENSRPAGRDAAEGSRRRAVSPGWTWPTNHSEPRSARYSVIGSTPEFSKTRALSARGRRCRSLGPSYLGAHPETATQSEA